MSDSPPSPNEKKLPETPDTDDESFPGDENITVPVKLNPAEFEIPEDDESPIEYERSASSSPVETDDLGEDTTGSEEGETSVADESDAETATSIETKVGEDQESETPAVSSMPLGKLEEGNTDEEDNTDTDSDDEDLYQKLELGVNSTTLLEKHPGVTQSSYAEILTLTKVVRNDKGEIIDDLHRTYPFVTKYEQAKIIGVRTKQLNNGADPLVEVSPDIIDGYNIALKEFEAKKLPFIISRPLPNGASEYWRLADLEMVHY